MNKYRIKHLIAMQLCSIVLLMLVVAGSAKAQNNIPSAPLNGDRSDLRNTLAFVPPLQTLVYACRLECHHEPTTRAPTLSDDHSLSPEELTAIMEMTLGGLKSPEVDLPPGLCREAL